MQKSLKRLFVAAAAVVAVLAVGMSPSFARKGVTHLASGRSGVATPAPATGDQEGPPRYAPSAGFVATEVTFANGGTTLHGSVVRRADLDTSVRHPGVVLVHGSGVGYRAGLTQEAEALASAGIVALIYDKRADYSKFHRDFSALAGDALAGVRALRTQPYVDADKVGLWGFSEGGWVAPLAASRSTDVRFLITLGGSGWSPARTQAWFLGGLMSHRGVTATTADGLANHSVEVVAGLGLFPAAGYDPVPVLNRIRQPVLAFWGERDALVPPRESAQIFSRQLTASPSVTLRILPGASHAGRVTEDGYHTPGGPTIGGYPDGQLTPGYAEAMTSWISAVTGGAVPASSSDALPRQRHDSAPVTPVGWPGFAVFALLLAALLSWPIAAVIRRIRGRRGAAAGARPARWLVATGLLTALGSAGYLVAIVAAQGAAGMTLLGQPLPWLLLRLLLVAALVCAVLLVRACVTGRAGVTRTVLLRAGLLTFAAVLLTQYALRIGLLLP
ncbi:alpha/beta hydrolase family protein [Micromonospora sp. NPDC003776]